MMRCMKFQSEKRRSHSREGVENAKVSNRNDKSPQSCRECPAPSHSTPIREKNSLNNVEESPELDYCPSPMLLPYTQEGGNEIAWDWQSSLSKTPDGRSKRQNVQCETPKGTKMLQKKRNSNSPLLYKPLKRKTIKMESIENIGQFAAELQALNERMRIMRQNYLDNCVEEDAPASAVNTSNDRKIVANEQNCTEINDRDDSNVDKLNTSYNDLFDDSIDDSMAKCTQEIEEKFNLIAVEGNSTVCSQTSIKMEEPSRDKTNDKALTVRLASDKKSSETSDLANEKNISHNNILKTYSKLSFRKEVGSGQVTSRKDRICPNNNDMIQRVERPCDNGKPSKDNISEFDDFPDDSFDDCLATCIEDEKLLSTSTESGEFLACRNDNTRASCKSLTHAPLKGMLFRNSVVSGAKLVDSFKTTAKVEAASTASLDNRKFFKTKSLSDQYIGQNAITNAKDVTGGASASRGRNTARSALHLNSLAKCSMISRATSVTRAPVSTKSLATNDRCKIVDDESLLMHSAGRTHGSDVNRSAVRDGGDRFVKYNSTGNMTNGGKETTKTSSQPTLCTAEEIERKRQRAKMLLEAKRKLYSTKGIGSINR